MLLDRKTDAPAGAAPLRVAQLQHLDLDLGSCTGQGDDLASMEYSFEARRDMGDALEDWVVPHLTSLTYLNLGFIPPACNLHVSNMLGLQELRFERGEARHRGGSPAHFAKRHPAGQVTCWAELSLGQQASSMAATQPAAAPADTAMLCRVLLQCPQCMAPTEFSEDTFQNLERLTALQILAPYWCDLEPSCLLSVTTNLTSLRLEKVELQPLQAQHEGALGSSQLLQVVARLSALQNLELNRIEGQWPQQQLSAYSALTASSNLQELKLQHFEIPSTAWVHVFPAGRQVPHLTSLWAWPAAPDSAGIVSLVSCCPAVEAMRIDTCADVSLTPLKSLTALTNLLLGVLRPAAIRSDLAAMVHLKRLFFSLARGDALLQHLVPLTALTNLTGFCPNSCGMPWIYSNVSQRPV
jgi:hypothetical protein